ncbi:M42 family metallopeptidase [Limnochorda pilosa]
MGPSGAEGEVRRVLEEELRGRVDRLETDALGNLYAIREPGGPGGLTVMLDAHTDEIGLVVTYIEEEGFLRVAPIGGVSPQVALGQRVRFAGGAEGSVAADYLEEIKDLELSHLLVDIGASSRSEAAARVQVGEAGVFVRPVAEAGEHRLIAKAADDRAGCAVLVETLKALDGSPHRVVAVFAVQEEVGLRGARTAAFRVQPDLAVAVDVTPTGDTPKAPKRAVELGKGPAVKAMDRSVIAHPAVRRLLTETAREAGIPYQVEVLTAGGTDAGPIHTSRNGVPTGAVSIPCRHLHTPAEMVDLRDMEGAKELLLAVLRRPVLL